MATFMKLTPHYPPLFIKQTCYTCSAADSSEARPRPRRHPEADRRTVPAEQEPRRDGRDRRDGSARGTLHLRRSRT